MFRRLNVVACLTLFCLCFSANFAPLHAQDDQNARKPRKYKVPPPAAHIEVTILRDSNGKPISDAHVIFHPYEGDHDRGYLELKTNEEGKAVIEVLPIGDMVRMQVIAKGFQTYGEDYKVDKDNIVKEVRMKKPSAQYSVYNHPSADASAPDKGAEAKPDQPKTEPQPPKAN